MSEPKVTCYEIYLEGKYEESIVRIYLPPELGGRFKTIDPSSPSDSFLSSLVSNSDILDNIDNILDTNISFPGDKRAPARSKILRSVLSEGNYEIKYQITDCSNDPDSIKGDPSNGDEPYPSVNEEVVTPSEDDGPDNSDEKCYNATFVIHATKNNLQVKITVNLQSSQNPLPTPISSSLTNVDVIKDYINDISPDQGNKVAASIGDGSVIRITWDGDFWKVNNGRKPCADKDGPPAEPNEDHPEELEFENVCVKRPMMVKLNGEPVDDDVVEYCVFDGYLSIDTSIFNYGFDNTGTPKSELNKKIIDIKDINKSLLSPKGKQPTNFNVTPNTFIPNSLVPVSWDTNSPPKFNGIIPFGNVAPLAITIDVKIDTILNYEFYFVGTHPRPLSADLFSQNYDRTVEIELAEEIDGAYTGKPGMDFNKVWPIIQDTSILDVYGGPIVTTPEFPLFEETAPPALGSIFKVSVPISGDIFKITLPLTGKKFDVSNRDKVIKCSYSIDADSFRKILANELQMCIIKNTTKIQNEVVKLLSKNKFLEKYLTTVVDLLRGILLEKCNKIVTKNKDCYTIYYEDDHIDVKLYVQKMSFGK
jgi:hypothetical protein